MSASFAQAGRSSPAKRRSTSAWSRYSVARARSLDLLLLNAAARIGRLDEIRKHGDQDDQRYWNAQQPQAQTSYHLQFLRTLARQRGSRNSASTQSGYSRIRVIPHRTSAKRGWATKSHAALSRFSRSRASYGWALARNWDQPGRRALLTAWQAPGSTCRSCCASFAAQARRSRFWLRVESCADFLACCSRRFLQRLAHRATHPRATKAPHRPVSGCTRASACESR